MRTIWPGCVSAPGGVTRRFPPGRPDERQQVAVLARPGHSASLPVACVAGSMTRSASRIRPLGPREHGAGTVPLGHRP
jgi:hypothetical protein